MRRIIKIVLEIIAMLCFLSAHYLVSIYQFTYDYIFFGVPTMRIMVDVCLWAGIVLLIITIIMEMLDEK